MNGRSIPPINGDFCVTQSSLRQCVSFPVSKVNDSSFKLSLVLANVRSVCNKLDILRVFIDHNSPDILAVTESWGRPSLLDSFICHEDYVLFRQDRTSKMGGGVFLLVKKSLSPHNVNFLHDDSEPVFEDSVWCSIPLPSRKSLLLGCFYRSPSSTSSNDLLLEKLFDKVSDAATDFRVLVGDFNCPDIDWINLSSSPPNHFLLNCCLNNYLSQIVQEPTRGDNILDLVFVNDLSFTSTVEVTDEFPGSDHRSVSCIFEFDAIEPQHSTLTSQPWKPDFQRADWTQYRLVLSTELNSRTIMRPSDVEEMWDGIKSSILAASNLCVPERKSVKHIHGVPLTGTVRLAFRRRKDIFRSLRRSNSHLAEELRRNADSQLKSAIEESRRAHETGIANACQVNPKRFWSHVRSSLGNKSVVSSVCDSNGSLTQSQVETADCLNQYFSSVFSSDSDCTLPCITLKTQLRCDSFDISENTVIKVLRDLPCSSSPGPDGIPNILLVEGRYVLAEVLVTFFQLMLKNGKLPSEWKTALVTPIHKGGSRSMCSNYRPVSLTCTLCKVFERLVKDHMLDHLLKNQLLHGTQHGFLPRRSCATAILSFLNDVTNAVDDHQQVDAVFLDFSKAFDSISHSRLLMKLKGYGFGGQILTWISSYLSDRTQSVKIGNCVSDPIVVVSGVPQGSVLGPLLFVIYIDDLDDVVQDSTVVKYADDTKLYLKFSQTNIRGTDLLQNDLHRVAIWCSTWSLKLNSSKCSCLHFGLHNPNKGYFIGDANIKSCVSAKDLGIIITDDLKPTVHCLSAIAKAQKMLSVIKLAFKFLDIRAMTTLYKSFVLPLLDYCSIAWCPFYIKDIEALERVQRRFTKILPVYRNLPYEERLIKYNITSLYTRRIKLDLVWVYKIIHDQVDLPSESLFEIDSESRTRGHKLKLKFSHSRLDVRRHWFASRIIPLWNALPSNCVEATSVASFKVLLDSHLRGMGSK